MWKLCLPAPSEQASYSQLLFTVPASIPDSDFTYTFENDPLNPPPPQMEAGVGAKIEVRRFIDQRREYYIKMELFPDRDVSVHMCIYACVRRSWRKICASECVVCVH